MYTAGRFREDEVSAWRTHYLLHPANRYNVYVRKNSGRRHQHLLQRVEPELDGGDRHFEVVLDDDLGVEFADDARFLAVEDD